MKGWLWASSPSPLEWLGAPPEKVGNNGVFGTFLATFSSKPKELTDFLLTKRGTVK